jgi:Glycosyltransferase WbsX
MSTEVFAYYFPQYHRDVRNDVLHKPLFTEWELLRAARPRFPGHRQPIVSAWGEFDEADPHWMGKQIDLAAHHSINGFIFDWYWYEGKPFLERALNEGFLQASNRHKLKFALMWANHDWLNIFPAKAGTKPALMMPGASSLESFDKLTDYVIESYFSQPNYLLIDGAPYFAIYELGTFIQGMGGLETAKKALEMFTNKVIAAGFAGLHLNAVVWGVQVLPSEMKLEHPREIIDALGLSSITSYVWVHHYDMNATTSFTRPYQEALKQNVAFWEQAARDYTVPYYPNVSMGWDATPRTQQNVPYQVGSYPWTAVMEGNTPAAFKKALQDARHFLDAQSFSPKLLTINAWNEWTEGSYLLPDTVNGTAYLEAIREVFEKVVVSARRQ